MIKKEKNNWIVSIASLALMLFLTIPAQAQLPDHFNFDDNYYTTYGEPEIEASIIGDNEFSRGDTITIAINLMNNGVITGFESDEDIDFGDEVALELQKQEMEYESQRTTAIGIAAGLASENSGIIVKSGTQQAGSLRSGEELEKPIEFTLEISRNASFGEYPLVLNIMYGYQENVQITGDEKTDDGITNVDVGLWYEKKVQEIVIPIKVKEEADFEIVNVTGDLTAGEEGLIHVTYKNKGEISAKDSTVRITVADPFSTTDDQAYLGSLDPSETAVATFKLKVDETATPKVYGITSEIKYEDEDRQDQMSNTMKVNIKTQPKASGSEKYTVAVGLLGMVFLGAVGYKGYRRIKGK
jgi:uncharacterized membrane protein